jgi:hypothetical protein
LEKNAEGVTVIVRQIVEVLHIKAHVCRDSKGLARLHLPTKGDAAFAVSEAGSAVRQHREFQHKYRNLATPFPLHERSDVAARTGIGAERSAARFIRLESRNRDRPSDIATIKATSVVELVSGLSASSLVTRRKQILGTQFLMDLGAACE